MIIYELSEFHDPRALETWSTANMRFQKYMVVNEKMSPPFVIPEELVFFADTCIYPTAAFCCCWPSALRESSVWSQHPSQRRPHKHRRSSREVAYTDFLLQVTEYIFDHIQVQMWILIHEDPRNTTKQWQLWHAQNRHVHTPLPTRTHIDKEPKALRWKTAHRSTHRTIDPQPTRPHTHTSPDTPGRK